MALSESEKAQLSHTDTNVRDLKIALMGNPELGTTGFIQEVRTDIIELKRDHASQLLRIEKNHKELNDRVEKIEKADYKKGVVIATASAGVGAVTGATGMEFLKTWLMKIFAISTFIK